MHANPDVRRTFATAGVVHKNVWQCPMLVISCVIILVKGITCFEAIKTTGILQTGCHENRTSSYNATNGLVNTSFSQGNTVDIILKPVIGFFNTNILVPCRLFRPLILVKKIILNLFE